MPEKLLWTTLDRKHWSYDWAKVVGVGEGQGVWWFGLEFFQPKGSFLRKLEGDSSGSQIKFEKKWRKSRESNILMVH